MVDRILVSVIENMEEPCWLFRVEPFMQKVMENLNYDKEEISLLFCNDTFIAELNNTYRKVEGPTDILSFENGEEYTDKTGTKWMCAGDILISLEMLEKNAAYFSVDKDSELKRLLIHGVLHLNGMDHGEEHIEQGIEPICDMLKLQEKTLVKFSSEHIIG
jgi:probable rRNA maturation factor